MSRTTCDITISLDGFVAGPGQSEADPLGAGGERLHRWMFEHPEENAAELAAILEAGAYVMGRNMFGPGRGDWDLDWTGWWGAEPPYHAAVFVLTHHPREPLAMAGGTTFTFVTDGIDAAIAQARAAAGGKDVAIAGGASTVRQALASGSLDELRLHLAPVLLGSGERVFDGLGDIPFEPVAARHGALVTHLTYRVAHPGR